MLCSLFPLLSVCLTVPQRAPLSCPPENKQPSLSFQGGVLTLRCLCCRCHLLSLFFCCRSPMARPPVMAGVLPTGTRCGETVSVKHKHLTDPARVKILAWRPRKLQSKLPFLKQDILSSSRIANVSAPFPAFPQSQAFLSQYFSKCYLNL